MRRMRWWLVAACLASSVPLVWRASEVAAELHRDRLAAAAYDGGTALLYEGRFEAAAMAFREAISFSPKEPEPYRSLAEAEFKRGRIDAAVNAYRQLTAIYPYTYYSTLYWEIAIIEIHASRLKDARRDLLKAVAIDPDDWRSHYLLGIVYRRLGDASGARAAWQRVLSLQPDNPHAHEQLRRLDAHTP